MLWKKIQAALTRHLAAIARGSALAILALYLLSKAFAPAAAFLKSDITLIQVLVLFFLAELAKATSDVTVLLKDKPYELFPSQDEASLHIRKLLDGHRPGLARFLGTSASHRVDLMTALRDRGWRLQILVQHPKSAHTEALAADISQHLDVLVYSTFDDYPSCEIRSYKAPAFLRGSTFENLGVAIGWYIVSSTKYGVSGSRNPVLFASDGSAQAHHLNRMFAKAFDLPWNDPDTEAVEKVAPNPSSQRTHPGVRPGSAAELKLR